MQENGATVLANPLTDQRFEEISDDMPEIGSEDSPPQSSETGATDSAATAKRGRGRPPKPVTDAASEKPRAFRYFPPPPKKYVGTQKEFGQDLFLKYFRRVGADPEFKNRVVVYGYRMFPVTDVNPPGDFVDQDAAKTKKYIDCTSQPFDGDEDVYNRYGAGDYKFFLNDAGHPGRAKTQMVCYFTGTREWEKYPPLLDLKTLVLNDPKNQSYIRYLQSKGLMPKPGNEGDDEEMANVEVVREMQSTLDKLTDKLISQSERPVPAQVIPIQPRSQAETDVANAVKAVTESFSQANTVQMRMLSDAVDKATAVQAKTQDPFDTLGKVISTIRELYPKQDTSQLEAALHRADALEQKVDALTEALKDQRIKELEERLQQQQQQQQLQAPKDTLTQAREFAQLQREMKDIFGVGGGSTASDDDDEKPGRESREPWYAKHLPTLLGVGSFLVSGIASIVHNQAVARTGQGNPTPPPPPPPEAMPPGMQQMAGMIGAPVPPPAPGAPQTMSPQEQQIQMFVKIIETPLKRHLDDGLSGHDFAAWLIDSYGDTNYQQVRAAGAQNILNAIQQYSPQLFAEMQRIPERSQQFINEFLQGPGEEEVN